jgi:hypothetical protein
VGTDHLVSASAKTPLRAAIVLASLTLFATAAFGGQASAATPTKTTKTTKTTTTKSTTSKTTTKSTATAAKAPLGPTGKKCWNALIRDWYDGRIDKTYEVHCYQDALKHLPQDVRTYSDAYDVISRALADATRGKTKIDPTLEIAPPESTGTSTGKNTTTGTTTTTGATGNTNASGGPIGGVLNGGGQDANSVPIPLLVLAGLAVLLVAAGGAGLVYRRYQARGGRP